MTRPLHPLLVGCGVVGRAIAMEHLRHGLSISIADIDSAAVDNLCRVAEANFSVAIFPSFTMEGMTTRRIASNNEASSPVDVSPQSVDWFVLESIAEQLSVKQTFFRTIQTVASETSFFCSNTSTIPISAIASGLPHPGRLCGFHLFMPVRHRPAVEVIASQQTDSDTIAAAKHHARALRKVPLVVRDTPGFVVNRLLSPYLNEALLMLGEGVSAKTLDRSASKIGMAMSPLALMDVIGLRTAFDAGRYFWTNFPKRFSPSPILAGMIKRQRRSDATIRFLRRDDPELLSDEAREIVERYRVDGPMPGPEDVADRMKMVMLHEASVMLADGVVDDPSIFEAAMRHGLGFDHQRGWLKTVGDLSESRHRQLADRYATRSAAMNYRPPITTA